MSSYKITANLVIPDENGVWEIIGSVGPRTLIENQSGQRRYAWRVNSEILTMVKLAPLDRYRKNIGGEYHRHPKGIVIITGTYPFFRTNRGTPVWIDYDRSFNERPILPDELIARIRKNASVQAANRYALKKKRAGKGRQRLLGIRITTNIETTLYGWFIVHGERVIASGTAETRVLAELVAEKERQRLKLTGWK